MSESQVFKVTFEASKSLYDSPNVSVQVETFTLSKGIDGAGIHAHMVDVPPFDEPNMIPVTDFQAYIEQRINRRNFQERCRNGEISGAKKIGGRWHVPQSVIDDLFDEWKSDFVRRHSSLPDPSRRKAIPSSVASKSELERILLQILPELFSIVELRELCVDLGVNYELVQGTTISELSMELIAYMKRRNRLDDLVKRIKEVRPNI